MYFISILALGTISSVLAKTFNPIEDLGPQLSAGATIAIGNSSAPRWSEYAAPQPGYTVNVADELDVAKTVKYCNENGINFLAQSGAHSSPITFHIGKDDIVINLRGLNFTTLNEDKTQMLVGGGALNADIINAAYENNRVVLSGGCNCVGASGLTLGGGLSFYMTEFGMPVDNLVSLNLVTAKGDFINVSKSSYPDLFWALAGAGPNFGVVTSFTIKTHAVPDSRAWVSQLLFTGDRLEAYIDAMNNLNLTEKMVNNWGLNYLPPDYQPFITAGLLYHDPNDTAAREAFKPLFDIGPYSETTEILEHNHINDGVDDFCIKGGRKPSWHVGLKVLDYSTWQLVWNDWVQFVQKTNLTGTRVLVETYSNYVAREIGSDDTSYPHRAINFHAVFQSVYVDSKWDRDVEDIGSRVRSAWRSTDGFDAPRTYVNFAHGDEAPEDVYGESLPRLQELKAAWDPTNRFSQWLPLM